VIDFLFACADIKSTHGDLRMWRSAKATPLKDAFKFNITNLTKQQERD
jgi:hypothetical protein